ncbi:dTDP-glucose 4,6-dehydratase [Salsipaludibacter albus]|uniref:dTDP-glucose 4,6-dehydratase n=1 Tax=Salsipaludibacter albus TaxID=2849650 RepID=UPI001EE3F75A|nr:dTDP-glucose 4,6-dehydratase [Salsipaludibacter albus]MBY5161952.1 dTDP-glucose 4,6-dehydratase [Salsipaludibacter albus]
MAHLLVTGGAGFIGSNFIRRTLAADPHVVVTNLDALTYAGVRATVDELDADPRHTFVHGDVADEEVVAAAMDGVDAVVHFAAESHVDRSISGPGVFLRTNVVGTGTLLQAALEAGVDRFLHVSTDEVYGSIERGSASEVAPLAPSSPYSASKAGSDLLALSYHATHGLDVVVTRCSNNFGPYQFPEKVIPLFVTNLLEGRPVPLYGDGHNERDWLHVGDHCAALALVLERGEAGTVYNIGADAQLSNLELTHRILDQLGADASSIDHVRDRLGHDFRYAVDSSRIRALGWEPSAPFDQRLAETVAWYRSNRDWWEPLRRDLG